MKTTFQICYFYIKLIIKFLILYWLVRIYSKLILRLREKLDSIKCKTFCNFIKIMLQDQQLQQQKKKNIF